MTGVPRTHNALHEIPSMSKHFILLLIVAATGACSKSAPSSEAMPASAQPSGRRNASVITLDELLDPALSGQTVLEVVRKLRPNFLTTRGLQSRNNPEAGKVHVSINGSGVVSLDYLRTMALAGVTEIRLLSAAAAMQRFGGAAQEGPVILVVTM